MIDYKASALTASSFLIFILNKKSLEYFDLGENEEKKVLILTFFII